LTRPLAATRYVHDVRRRRQLLVLRRLAMGFLTSIVLIFGQCCS
jgi:hypothetical protein